MQVFFKYLFTMFTYYLTFIFTCPRCSVPLAWGLVHGIGSSPPTLP